MSGIQDFIVNALTRITSHLVPDALSGDAKHDRMYCDYGYPTNITFEMCYRMWRRNGYASAGVDHAIETCWQTFPALLEQEKTHEQTSYEKVVASQFERLKFWAQLAEADRMSRVGEYSGVIFRFRDSKNLDQPVDPLAGGLESIAEIIPAWQGQLKVIRTIDDQTNENYGQPAMYQYNESAVIDANGTQRQRQFEVHPDRVHIWSKNQSVYGNIMILEKGYNDLLTIQKIIGAGGEGFWKNAKTAPILNVDKETKMQTLATQLGLKNVDEVADKIDEIVRDYSKGLDASMMFQGIDVKTLQATLPIPDKFVLIAAQSFAASINEPLKLLVGNQNGERASTEDNKQWNKTCESRRNNYCKPNIMAIVNKLVNFGVLEKKSYFLLWADLTESTTDEKINIADKMAGVNQKMIGYGEAAFTPEEIRETAGWKGSTAPIVPKRDPKADSNTNTD